MYVRMYACMCEPYRKILAVTFVETSNLCTLTHIATNLCSCTFCWRGQPVTTVL